MPGAPKKKSSFSMLWIYALLGVILVSLFYMQDGTASKDVSWTEFEKTALNGNIEKISIDRANLEAKGTLNKAGIKAQKFDRSNNYQGDFIIKSKFDPNENIQNKIDKWNELLAKNNKAQISVSYEEGTNFMRILVYFLPIIIIIAFFYFMTRRSNGANSGGIFSVGKSKAKIFDKDNSTNVTFKDVAGLAEAKVEVEEIVDFLKNPRRYTELGAKIPKGALLVGPPGTGKTLLAKAVAGEANVPFLSMSGSDFVEMFVGVGAARVRDLFKQAKEKAPCIIFIDEIDAVGRARGKNPNMGANDERENTLNQMLSEMDGFATNNGIIILAATNRADMLDKALLRPGRFDRQIYVDLPELHDRIEIFNVHLRNIKVNATIDVEQLARQTPGFSGADVANVCNEAALIAARNNKMQVDWSDFMTAIDRIIGGLEKQSRILTDSEKRAIAVHEAGHTVVGWLTRYSDPLVKVTIVPRGKALGANWFAPEEAPIITKQALLDKIACLLGGRAAEEIILGEVGTGASNDLERATKAARAMVIVYGMGDSIPNLNYYDSTGQEYGFSKPYSEETARLIDIEVEKIVNEQYTRAKQLLTDNVKGLTDISNMLIEQEVIYHDDVQNILGKRPWKYRSEQIIEIRKDKGLDNKLTCDKTNNSNSDNQNNDSENTDSETRLPLNGFIHRTLRKNFSQEEETPAVDDSEKNENGEKDDDAGTPPPFTKK